MKQKLTQGILIPNMMEYEVNQKNVHEAVNYALHQLAGFPKAC